MDLYYKIASGSLEPTDEIFQLMVKGLFEYDEGFRIYEDFDKAPVFYKEFMGKDCTPFFDVLLQILQGVKNPNITVYKDVNIVTLMAFATFHMNKLYCIQKKVTTLEKAKKCAQFISEPFALWLSTIHKKYPNIERQQESKYIRKPHIYILLNSYVSYQKDVLRRIIKPALYTTENLLNELIIPLTDDMYSDMYEFGLIVYRQWNPDASQYTIANNFIPNTINFFSPNKGSINCIFFRDSILRNIWRINDISLDTNKIYEYTNTLSTKQYELCMIINAYNDIFFDYRGEFIKQNEKTELYFRNMFKLIEESDDLVFETLHFISFIDVTFFLKIKFSNFTKETILHPILRNVMRNPESKNIKFVRHLLTQWFNHNSQYSIYKSNDYPYNAADYLISFLNYFEKQYYQDLVFEILNTYFEKIEVKESLIFGYRSTQYTTPKYSLKLSLDSPSNSPGLSDVKKMKGIIQLFIKHFCETKYDDILKQSFFQKLQPYKQSLRDIGIDIDKYSEESVGFSPVLKSKSPKRSIDKENFSTPAKMNSHKNNIFYKKTEQDQVTVFQGINFADKTLLHKLQKYYIRTVAGMSADDYDKPDRIIKIRKYLQKRYPIVSDFEYKLRVHKGKDLETLYNHWLNDANQMTLNSKYYIINIDENGRQEDGIDAGGLTKSFFTNVSKQMKDMYFKQAYENSDKYILDTSDPNVARFIGELLCVLILREIYLDFSISTVYLGHLLYDNLKAEEQFLYYLLDIESDLVYNYHLKYCENKYECKSEDDENYYYAMACNPEYIVKETMVDIYQQESDVFKAFCKGFFIEKKIFYNKFFNIGKSKIRIYDMDKLLTMIKLTKKALKSDIFDKVQISGDNTDIIYKWFEELMTSDTKQDYEDMYKLYDTSYIKDDEEKQNEYKKLVSQQVFKQKVLLYWTGSRGILNQEYFIHIQSGISYLIISHTCTNTLELPNSTQIRSKQMLFDKFMEMFIVGLESGYSDR
jgi:hypothetical protein